MFGGKFHIYTAHIDPKLPEPYESAVFIEEGFSFMAFIFSGLWTLYHRLWWPAFGIIVCNLIFLQLQDEGVVSEAGRAILSLGLNTTVGYMAHDWLRAKLARKGYVMADIVTGDTKLRAEQRFFERYFPTSPAAA